MWRRVNLTFGVFLILSVSAFYWLLRDNHHPGASAKPLSIAALRALAGSIPGSPPTAVEAELIAWRRTPHDVIAAGAGLRQALLATLAYRLERPGLGPIVVDSGIRPSAARSLELQGYQPQAQARVEASLHQASLALLTSEHPEHSDGLRSLGRKRGTTTAARLSLAQRQSANRSGMRTDTAAATAIASAVAPGVVVIPTPTIGAGAQMIYVRFASGREFLFAGDAAMLDVNWRQLRAHSRLAGLLGTVPARRESFAWLLTIRALKRQAPGMLVVPGHDLRFLRNPEAKRPRMKLQFGASRRDGDATT